MSLDKSLVVVGLLYFEVFENLIYLILKTDPVWFLHQFYFWFDINYGPLKF